MQPSGIRPSGEGTPQGSSRRLVPIVIAAAVVIGVIAVVVFSRGGGESSTTTTAPPNTNTDATNAVLLPPAVSYPVAQAEGTADDIDWGPRCDTERGRLALPLFPQQFCFKPFEGDNGGETSPGVTADTIKVVVYLTQDDDPVLRFIYSQIQNDDTQDQVWETYQKLNEMFSKYYETYGRKVELIRFDATGNISDPVAATADAETIANDIRPFMVIGGPLLTNAFQDTLAAKKVMCVSCGPSQPAEYYAQRAPYVWDIGKPAGQNLQLVAEYLGKRLAGGTAKHAGGDLQGKPRVFGYIHIVASDNDQKLEDAFTAQLRDDYDLSFAQIATYRSPTDLPGTGRDMITRMKEAGVTTIVFYGDPLAPQTLTRIATEQQYFPEWIVTGSVLVDTAAFSRTYDQQQWSRAFGVSNLTARVDPSTAGALYLYRWYYGEDAPADQTIPVLLPNIQFLYNPLQAVGTNLTPENIQKVLFGAPIIPSTPITPQISYGNRGVWPDLDFAAVDDQTEVWWDPEAVGPDELGRVGPGLYRYVDGGRRYLPGQWPKGEPKVFVQEGSVTIFDEAPEEAKLPTDYVPLR